MTKKDRKSDNIPILGIVVPCYNEEEVLGYSNELLTQKIRALVNNKYIHPKSFIVYVNDGSSDNTWTIIKQLIEQADYVKGINMSRNFGHQSALFAGISTFNKECDCIVTIDADLQDDIAIIQSMIDHFNDGSDIVYGVRQTRKTDRIFKRYSALFFYRIMKILGVDVVFNHADFRLTSKRFNEELLLFEERNLFLRGIVPTIGFKQSNVYYDRMKRPLGNTKYPLRKMISFALEGITSFSVKPLRIITISGLMIFLLCLVFSVIAVLSYYQGNTVRGWVSTVLPFFLLGGLQIFFIGIIGEYIGKIYKEIKRRPRFIIKEVVE